MAQPDPPMDRVLTDVPGMPWFPLTIQQTIAANGSVNLTLLKEHFLREGRIDKQLAMHLISKTKALFKAEPNVLDLKYPITVCGDVHGQYYDLIRLFEVGGDPKDTQFLFLGDYVDRGCFSCEVVFYLYALKMTYPKTFFMLRGNHECRQLTSFFNFKDECVYKYDLDIYEAIMDSFDALPLAAVVNKSFFCVHGGLSPDIQSIQNIQELPRFQEIPREGPMCDLLWSDPYESDSTALIEADAAAGGHAPGAKKNAATSWFGFNDVRQCSFVYGMEAVKQFLGDNGLTSIIRAHEAQLDGYKMQFVHDKTNIPLVITIFSAPNYCDVYRNKAACLKFDNNVLNIKQFVDVDHPYFLPNFMNVFQWSLPFVAEKVTDMLAHVISSAEGDSDTEDQGAVRQRAGLFKKKVLAVTKLRRLYAALQEDHELFRQLKQLTSNQKIPQGLISKGPEEIRRVLATFDGAKASDRPNEAIPGPPSRSSSLAHMNPLAQASPKASAAVGLARSFSFTLDAVADRPAKDGPPGSGNSAGSPSLSGSHKPSAAAAAAAAAATAAAGGAAKRQ